MRPRSVMQNVGQMCVQDEGNHETLQDTTAGNGERHGSELPWRFLWGERRGLNPRQPESQSGALPTELRPP